MPIADLNLLRLFDVLLEERSVTRAGVRLGLSQSAVSHALGRLRHMLNDELFVRGPSGMQPTPRALEIGSRVHAALGQLQAALARPDFDPATSDRRFVMVSGAYAAMVLAPSLVARLARLAPEITLSLRGQAPELLDLLDTRQADFAVTGVISAPDRFAREMVLAEELAWVVAADSPLAARATVDLKALAATPHVTVVPQAINEDGTTQRGLVLRASWEDAGAFDMALAAEGLKRRVAVTVPDTFSALAVVARSHMATLAPRRLALAWAEAGRLALIEPPYASPPVELTLMFLKDRLQEPPVAWMRTLIHEVARDL